MEFVIVLVVLIVVVLIVSGPLRREWSSRSRGQDEPAAADGQRARTLAELEAAREAKYREIRDAELDHRTGKLSEADYEMVDRTLRAEAVEILHELDRVRGSGEPAPDGEGRADGRP
jgi:flagellar biosynthesis/type III secretory pathway M-ring protein FliF/YscJ